MGNEKGVEMIAADRKRSVAETNVATISELANQLYDAHGNVRMPAASAIRSILAEIAPIETSE